MQVSLTVRNTGTTPFAFTGALHTYFSVSDIAGVNLMGLNGHEYRDAAAGNAIRSEADASLLVTAEVDHVYHHVQGQLMLEDGAARFGIAAASFADVVVWNPWHALCAKLPDMSALGYRKMLCVEAAVAQFPVTVAAGEVWSGSQKLTDGGL